MQPSVASQFPQGMAADNLTSVRNDVLIRLNIEGKAGVGHAEATRFTWIVWEVKAD
ncbi:MAG: hypothetical protein AAGG44_07295 [Planctomycetota bacterium]